MLVLQGKTPFPTAKTPCIRAVRWNASGTFDELIHGEGQLTAIAKVAPGGDEAETIIYMLFDKEAGTMEAMPDGMTNADEVIAAAKVQPMPEIFYKFMLIRDEMTLVGLLDGEIVEDLQNPSVVPLVRMRVECRPCNLDGSDVECYDNDQMPLLSDGEKHYEARKGDVKELQLDGPFAKGNLAMIQEAVGKFMEANGDFKDLE